MSNQACWPKLFFFFFFFLILLSSASSKHVCALKYGDSDMQRASASCLVQCKLGVHQFMHGSRGMRCVLGWYWVRCIQRLRHEAWGTACLSFSVHQVHTMLLETLCMNLSVHLRHRLCIRVHSTACHNTAWKAGSILQHITMFSILPCVAAVWQLVCQTGSNLIWRPPSADDGTHVLPAIIGTWYYMLCRETRLALRLTSLTCAGKAFLLSLLWSITIIVSNNNNNYAFQLMMS